MSRIPLDLSKFRKVETGKDTSTFEHYEGHKFVVAHNKLSKKMRDQLEKIPLKEKKVQHFAEAGEVQPNIPLPNGGMEGQQLQDYIAQNPGPPATTGYSPGNDAQDKLDVEPVDPNTAEAQAPADQAQAMKTNAPAQPEPQQQAPAPTDQGQAAAPAAPMPTDHKQAALKDYTQEDQAFAQDLKNGHITPQTYQQMFHDKGTLGKIGTIFGLMLSGAGAGLTHQPNAMLGMMNAQIQNDLNAQEKSKDNAVNFLKLNQQNELNKASIKSMNAETALKARTLSNMQMNQAALHKLTSDVQNMPLGSPQRAQAEQTLGMLAQGVQNENYQLADRAASMTQYMKMLNPQGTPQGSEQQFQQQTNQMKLLGPQGQERAKDMEEHHYPGIPGKASVPLQASDREALGSGINFDQKLDRFINWTQGHSGDLNPADRNQGEAMASELQGAYRQATHGGVYKEGEQNFISKLIDNTPTKFFNSIRVVPQLQAISGENKARIDQTAKNLGFPGYPGAQQSQSSGSSPQYKMYNGVKYTRGPNGEAVPVK